MSVFRLDPIHTYSKEEQQTMWNDLVVKGFILFAPEDDKTKVNLRLLSRSLQHEHSWVFAGVCVPPNDSRFEAICNQYKDEWEKHKPNIVNTAKTHTITEKVKPLP